MHAARAGPVIMPKGAFQHALFWTMPLTQPLLILLTGSLAFFAVAFGATAALHYQPYVAPLLLLPAFWLALFCVTLWLLAALKWVLLGRVRPGGYEKYSWAFQTKTLYTALTVSFAPVYMIVCACISGHGFPHDALPAPLRMCMT
jgi:hypothetical protein